MPETPHNAPRRAPWKPAVALLLTYTIVVAVAAVAMARRSASLPVEAKEAATRLVLSLLMIETVALAVGVPFLVAVQPMASAACVGGANRKLQITNDKQAPITKSPNPKRSPRLPNRRFGIWCLSFGACLSFVAWCLELPRRASGTWGELLPFLTAQRREGLRARLLAIAAPAAALALISLIVSAVAVRGNVAVAVLVCCQVFLLCFAALLAAGAALFAVLALRPTKAQLVVSATALAMLGSIFLANAVIESLPAGPPRSATIQALLWTNPWLVAGGTLLQADPVRSKSLYHQSVISYYGFRYPASQHGLAARTLIVSAAYSACALLLWAAARLAARMRPRGGRCTPHPKLLQ